MKNKSLNYTVIFKKEPEGGYTATVPLLPGCVTYGNNLDEAKKMAKEAIELYIESLEKHNDEIPEETDTFYSQVVVSPTPATSIKSLLPFEHTPSSIYNLNTIQPHKFIIYYKLGS